MHDGSNWHSTLQLRYAMRDLRCVDDARHDGAVRVLAALRPEGDDVCHHVLVHPPGGLVGGDRIDIALRVERGAHALLTTPGATRFYRSLGAPAVQTVDAVLEPGARLEWLPLEAIAYDGCIGRNTSRFVLQPGAEMIGWDLLALGLPAADAPFVHGELTQHVEIPGIWLEHGRIAADDRALRHAPGGLAGASALATLWFACGEALPEARAQALLDVARAAIDASGIDAGATWPQTQVVVVRALSNRVEPLQQLLRTIWAAWRVLGWQRPPCAPRVWRT